MSEIRSVPEVLEPVEDETSEGDVNSIGTPVQDDLPGTPRTPLGRRLREIRARIVASGVKLLNWEELEREIAERRGERRWPGD